MKAFLVLLHSECAGFIRERMAVFWNLALPLLLLVLQMAFFGSGVSLGPIKIAIVNRDGSTSSLQYAEFVQGSLTRQSFVRVKAEVLSAEPAAGDRYDAAITIPSGFAEAIEQRKTAHVSYSTLKDEGAAARAVAGILIGVTDQYSIKSTGFTPPVAIETSLGNFTQKPSSSYGLYLVSGLMVMVIVSTSLMGFAIPLVAARDGGKLQLYQIFPLSAMQVLGAFWVARTLVVIFCCAVLLGAAIQLYKIPVTTSPVSLATASLLVVAGAFAFHSVGMLIAAVSPSVMMATMLCNVLYFPLLFTGNLLLPTGALPAWLQEAMQFLPVNAYVASLRRALNGNLDLQGDTYVWIVLAVMTLTCAGLAHRWFSWSPQD